MKQELVNESEIRNPKPGTSPKSETRSGVRSRVLAFGLRAWFGFRISAFGILLAALFTLNADAQTTNQTFSLHAGWNSIWLELDPTNREVGAMFTNLPVASVW